MRHRYRLAFDLDETLVKGDVIRLASEELYSKRKIHKIYSGEDVNNYNLDPLPDVLKCRVRELFLDPEVAEKVKRPIEGTQTLLYYLISRGHSVYILTARPTGVYWSTIKSVYNIYNSMFDNGNLGTPIITFFANKCNTCHPDYPVSKMEVIEELKPDFYFDDNQQHCLEALSASNVFLIKNNHTGWNRNFSHPRVTELKSVTNLDVRYYGL